MHQFELRRDRQLFFDALRVFFARHLKQNLVRALSAMISQRRLGNAELVDAPVNCVVSLFGRLLAQGARG